MKKFTVLCMLFMFSICDMIANDNKTTLSTQIDNYQQDMIYFDCAQTPFIRQEFHRNPGEENTYSFNTDKIVTMYINGRIQVLLQGGDSLHAAIQYEGRNVQSIEFTGSPRAVAANQAVQDIENIRKNLRYKSQLLTCIALNVPPLERITTSRTLLDKVKILLKNAKGISPEAATYIEAETEGDAYVSFMEYPVMYAETRKTPVEKQNIGDYWKIMDGFQPKSDAVSLRCPEYISMLMRYCFYVNGKKAQAKGESYQMPSRFETMYKEIAAFYTGDVRDALLYTLISNFIRNGKEIERAETLLKDYKAKYNKNQEYMKILNSLLQ